MSRKIISIILFVMGMLLVFFEVISFSNCQQKIYDGVNSCFPTIGALFVALAMWNFCVAISKYNHNIVVKFLRTIGRNSLGVYLFHIPLIVFIDKCLNLHIYGWIETIMCVLFILIATVLLSYILKRLPIVI